MLLTCPTCSRSYTIARGDLGEAGRLVICSGCQTQWFAARVEGPPAASNDDDRVPNTIVKRSLLRPSKRPRTPRQLAAGPSFLERKIMPWAGRAVVAATIVGVLGASVTQRDKIARHAPRTAALYKAVGLEVNPSGLAFDALTPHRLETSDVAVAGGIRNVSRRRVAVPRLAFEVRDAAGSTLLSWSEAAPARTLGPGATTAFESTPHRLPAQSAIVTVRFASDAPGTKPIGKVASAQ